MTIDKSIAINLFSDLEGDLIVKCECSCVPHFFPVLLQELGLAKSTRVFSSSFLLNVSGDFS